MKLNMHTPLFSSIVRITSGFCFAEILAYTLVALAFNFSLVFSLAFLLLEVAFHVALLLFLGYSQNFFYIDATGRRLEKVNVANIITLLRISMLPFILFLIIAARTHAVAPILIPVLALTFLTDMVDGRLSRARNEVTYIGRILDSVSDYSLLVVIATAFCSFAMLPAWLFGCIFFRFAFQAIGMFILLMTRGKVEPQPTIFGKVTVATTMLLLALEALKFIAPPEASGLFKIIELVAGAIIGLSVIDKAVYFAKKARAPRT